MTAYLQYWKYIDVHNLASGDGLNHTAGDQLGRVSSGDTIWIVTLIDGCLHLVGRIVAGDIVSRRTAMKKLHTNTLWHARHHVLARRGTVKRLRIISVEEIASSGREQPKRPVTPPLEAGGPTSTRVNYPLSIRGATVSFGGDLRNKMRIVVWNDNDRAFEHAHEFSPGSGRITAITAARSSA